MTQNLGKYPEGIEHAGIVEEVKIEIETNVTLREEPHQNRQRWKWRRQVLPRGASHSEKFEARALDSHHRYVSF